MCNNTRDFLLLISDNSIDIPADKITSNDIATVLIYGPDEKGDNEMIFNRYYRVWSHIFQARQGIPKKMVVIIMTAYTSMNANNSTLLKKLRDKAKEKTDKIKEIIFDAGHAFGKIFSLLTDVDGGKLLKSDSPFLNAGKVLSLSIDKGILKIFGDKSKPLPGNIGDFATNFLGEKLKSYNTDINNFYNYAKIFIKDYINDAVKMGIEISALLLNVSAEALAESLNAAAAALDATVALWTLAVAIVNYVAPYCNCDFPNKEYAVDGSIPICYQGTCREVYGVGMNVDQWDNGSCSNCTSKYGKCYWGNGTKCASRVDTLSCWGKPLRTGTMKRRPTNPVQAGSRPQCRFDLGNLKNACKYGYIQYCPQLVQQPLYIVSKVFTENNVE